MAKEEFLIRLSLLEQQANQLEQQVQQVNEQIQEFEILNLNISKLGKEKEILALIGKGVFSKAKLEENKFFVSVGAGVVVKKNPEQAVKIVENQIVKLKEMRKELIQIISRINEELEKVVDEANNAK